MIEILKKLAPTLATLLVGPLGGVAVEALGTAMGMEKATREELVQKLESGNLTSADIAAIKLAEIAAKSKLDEMGVRLEELAVQDRNSARQMQMSVRSVLPPMLGFTVVAAFFYIGHSVLFGKVVATETIAGLLIGYLAAMAQMVMAYYFGSSSGSAQKNDLLIKARP